MGTSLGSSPGAALQSSCQQEFGRKVSFTGKPFRHPTILWNPYSFLQGSSKVRPCYVDISYKMAVFASRVHQRCFTQCRERLLNVLQLP